MRSCPIHGEMKLVRIGQFTFWQCKFRSCGRSRPAKYGDGSIRAQKLIQESKRMASINDVKKAKGGEGGSLLKGSDVPAKMSAVKVKVASIELAPDNFNAPAILRFSEEVYGCEGVAINKTNLGLLCEKVGVTGDDDFSLLEKKLKGKTVTLIIAMVNNPQTKQLTRGLQVSEVK
jgi:hypothetical protein